MVPVAEPIDSYTIAATSELATTNTSVTNERIHTVQSGDTLWSISERYQVGVQELMEWNQLDVNSILSLNQRLRVLVR